MRGVLMLSLGAAALGAVALVPVGGKGGHGHWHGGRGWGWGGGGGPRVYVGPSYRRFWAPGYGWVPCRWLY